MLDDQGLPEKLLDTIYDAASDDALWQSIFQDISRHTNSAGGILLGQSQEPRLLHFTHSYNTDQGSIGALRDRHMANPWTIHMQTFHPQGSVVLSDSILPVGELRRTSFYDEVLRPQSYDHAAMIGLSQKRGFGVGFCLNRERSRGPYAEREREFLQRLTPHMMRSIQFGFQIGAYRALQDAEHRALDRISTGVALLDRSARVLYANRALRAMTTDGALRLHGEKLSSASVSHARLLSDLVSAALRGRPTATMAIPHPADGRLVAVLVSSVRSRDLDRFTGLAMRDAAAMVYVIDPAAPTPLPPAWIMDVYGLTLAEARVAVQASLGRSDAEIGTGLNISPNTVKTHLRRVFAKIGVNGRTELAGLMASFRLMAGDR